MPIPPLSSNSLFLANFAIMAVLNSSCHDATFILNRASCFNISVDVVIDDLIILIFYVDCFKVFCTISSSL